MRRLTLVHLDSSSISGCVVVLAEELAAGSAWLERWGSLGAVIHKYPSQPVLEVERSGPTEAVRLTLRGPPGNYELMSFPTLQSPPAATLLLLNEFGAASADFSVEEAGQQRFFHAARLP